MMDALTCGPPVPSKDAAPRSPLRPGGASASCQTVARDTVEERILELQERKRKLADAALSEAGGATAITRDDLLALLS
jgi:hypothetical protein